MSEKIWLSKPHISYFEEKFIKSAFETNWLTTRGENIDEFEEQIENYIGEKKYAVALNSGTSAIHLALILLGVQENDEVICPSFTFCASANPILYNKAIPVFVDCEMDTWNICPFFLEEAIKDRIEKGKKPKAIIVVNSYGMPPKWDEIILISKTYNIPIVEDSAEALGAVYKNKKCGTFGDFGIFSFNGNKIITTSSGGALICKSKALKSKAILIATQANRGKTSYKHSELGFNYRMSNVLAGIGRGQMNVIEERIKQRRNVNFFYREIFKNTNDIILQSEPSSEYLSNFWLSCILINDTDNKYCLKKIKKIFKEKNIEVRNLWRPLHTQKLYKNFLYYGKGTDEYLFKNGLCLPSSSNLTNKELLRIASTLKNIFHV